MIIATIPAYALVAMLFAYLLGRFHEWAHDFPPIAACFWPATIPFFLIGNILWWLGELGERHAK
jgi:hypothetical protein